MRTKTKKLLLASLTCLLTGLIWFGISEAASLKELVEGARKEGQLNVMLPGTATPELVRGLEAAMNKYYGLNLKIGSSAAGSYTKALSILLTEHRTGTKPTFDSTVGYVEHITLMMDAGAVEPIQNWKELAPKGTPTDDKTISPMVLKNTAFKFADNFHILLYNTKLISEADLPKKLADFGNPKYKGKFSVPPWTVNPDMALLVYDKEKVLDIYRGWGKNEPKVLTYNQATDRMILGELWMVPFPNDYDYFRRKEAGDPVGMAVIQDLVPWNPLHMVVRTNASHPNAARLWALFNAGPEAQRIWEKEVKWMNFSYPQQSRAAEIKKFIDDSGAKVGDWLENEETIKLMRWLFTTKEGEAYLKRLVSAIQRGQ